MRRFMSIARGLSIGLSILWVASNRACSGDPPAAPDRVLHFPADRAMGIVSWRPAKGAGYARSMYDDWKDVGEARGDVKVPAGADVRLLVSQAASADLSGLDSLDADDVQALGLRDTDVNDEGLRHVGRLTGLRILDLNHTRITDAGIQHFSGLRKLQEIDLDAFRVNREGFGVGDGALEVLSQLPALASLGLRLTKVTDAGMAALARVPSLETLGIQGTKVSDAGLVHLAQLPRLEILALGVYREGANITDAGLAIVGEMTNLKYLNLSGTKVTNDGLRHLKNLTRLKSLSLEDTRVTEDGLVDIEPLVSLEQFRFGAASPITDAGAAHLAKLPSLREVSDNLEVTDRGVEMLARLPHLEQLMLFGDGVTDEGARHAARIKSLKCLWFQECPITDAGLAALADMPDIETLYVGKTRVSGDGFKHLAGLPRLRNLDVGFGERDEQQPRQNAPLREVGKLTQLQNLQISGDVLASSDLKALSGLAATLKELRVDLPVDDRAALVLGGFDALTTLQIDNGVMTDAGLRHLANLRKLQMLQISGHFTDKGVAHLARLKSLQHAGLTSPYVTEAGVQALARQLPSLQQAARYWREESEEIVVTDKDTIRRYGDADERLQKDPLEDRQPPAAQLTGWLNAPAEGLSFDKLRGTVVLVDFWGTWCGPCRALTPRLKQLHEKYQARGLVILGIHTSSGADEMADYVAKENLAWPMAADIDKATAEAWKVSSYPTLCLVDRWGKLRIAGIYRDDLERAVVHLLDETSDPAAAK